MAARVSFLVTVLAHPTVILHAMALVPGRCGGAS